MKGNKKILTSSLWSHSSTTIKDLVHKCLCACTGIYKNTNNLNTLPAHILDVCMGVYKHIRVRECVSFVNGIKKKKGSGTTERDELVFH